VFTERGNVTVSSVRSGASVVGQNGLLPAQISALKNLAEHDGKYRLKALARISSGSEIVFLTSVPAVNVSLTNLWNRSRLTDLSMRNKFTRGCSPEIISDTSLEEYFVALMIFVHDSCSEFNWMH